MKLSKMNLYGLLLLLVLFVLAVYIYPLMPEKAPVHWDFEGNPDSYGSRFAAVFLLPIIAAAVWLFMWVMEPLSPILERNPWKLMKTAWVLPRVQFLMVAFMLVVYVVTVGRVLFPELGELGNLGWLIALVIAAVGYSIRSMPEPDWDQLAAAYPGVENIDEKLHQKYAVDRKLGGNFILVAVLVLIVGLWSSLWSIGMFVVGILMAVVMYGVELLRKHLVEI